MVGLFLGFAFGGWRLFLRNAKVINLDDKLGGVFFKDERSHILGRGSCRTGFTGAGSRILGEEPRKVGHGRSTGRRGPGDDTDGLGDFRGG